MDKKEAVARILDHMRVHKIGQYPHIKIAEALEMAIAELRKNAGVEFLEDGAVYKIVKCKRCGKTVFLKYLSTKELDGGFAKVDQFEKMPDGWRNIFEIGTLCPVCAEKWEKAIQEFMEVGTNEPERNPVQSEKN